VESKQKLKNTMTIQCECQCNNDGILQPEPREVNATKFVHLMVNKLFSNT